MSSYTCSVQPSEVYLSPLPSTDSLLVPNCLFSLASIQHSSLKVQSKSYLLSLQKKWEKIFLHSIPPTIAAHHYSLAWMQHDTQWQVIPTVQTSLTTQSMCACEFHKQNSSIVFIYLQSLASSSSSLCLCLSVSVPPSLCYMGISRHTWLLCRYANQMGYWMPSSITYLPFSRSSGSIITESPNFGRLTHTHVHANAHIHTYTHTGVWPC